VKVVSHFQRAVMGIGAYLIFLAVAMVALNMVVSIARGDPHFTTLQFVLVLTVAAIPVAMPTVLSVTMAVGARPLAKKKTIATRLVAIEELGGGSFHRRPGSHPWPFLEDPVGEDPAPGGARHPGAGDNNRRPRNLLDATRLEVRGRGLGRRPRMVRRNQPGQAARLSRHRSRRRHRRGTSPWPFER
jgi:hypothetical protein